MSCSRCFYCGSFCLQCLCSQSLLSSPPSFAKPDRSISFFLGAALGSSCLWLFWEELALKIAAFIKPFYASGLQRWHFIVFTDILDNSRVISEDGKKKVGAVLQGSASSPWFLSLSPIPRRL